MRNNDSVWIITSDEVLEIVPIDREQETLSQIARSLGSRYVVVRALPALSDMTYLWSVVDPFVGRRVERVVKQFRATTIDAAVMWCRMRSAA